MTWEQIKLSSLQKMSASDGTDISNPDEATKEYLNAMPQAANEAIEMICTAGRYLRKSYTTSKDKGEALTVNLEYEVPDYWRMGNMEVYKLVDDTPEPVDGVALYGGKYLVFPAEYEGDFEFFYDAKPTTITLSTPDSKKIDLPDDAVVLLPLYIASQLYKDDDIAVATYYRNEFETAFERLTNPRTVSNG